MAIITKVGWDKKFGMPNFGSDHPMVIEATLEPGETKEEFWSQMNRDMIAWHKKEYPHIYLPFMQDASYVTPTSTMTTAGTGPMTIDLAAIREKEALEDQIIAATIKDQLTSIKDACEKAGLVSQYYNQLKKITNG